MLVVHVMKHCVCVCEWVDNERYDLENFLELVVVELPGFLVAHILTD